VVHAAEVNRVRDDEKGIPTVMRNVLPDVVLDAVSYSCYDAMEDGPTLFRAVEKLRKFARTTGVLGSGAVYVGEVGIPENIAPDRIEDRWDELMGAMLAVHVTHIVQWQLYCNEVKPERKSDVGYPVKDPDHLRGFWLVLPDGSLSRSGKWFSAFWEKCR